MQFRIGTIAQSQERPDPTKQFWRVFSRLYHLISFSMHAHIRPKSINRCVVHFFPSPSQGRVLLRPPHTEPPARGWATGLFLGFCTGFCTVPPKIIWNLELSWNSVKFAKIPAKFGENLLKIHQNFIKILQNDAKFLKNHWNCAKFWKSLQILILSRCEGVRIL